MDKGAAFSVEGKRVTVAGAARSGIAAAELVMIPDAGHLSNLEQPARFTGAVERFATKLFRLDG